MQDNNITPISRNSRNLTPNSSSPDLRKGNLFNQSHLGKGFRINTYSSNSTYDLREDNVQTISPIRSKSFRKSFNKNSVAANDANSINPGRRRPASASHIREPNINIYSRNSTDRLAQNTSTSDRRIAKGIMQYSKNDTQISAEKLNFDNNGLGDNSIFFNVEQVKATLPYRVDIGVSDLILTIYHCCHCSSHQMTTRHDEKTYIDNANRILEYSARILHTCQLNVRVGVRRIANPRKMGCFELTLTYQQPHGNRLHEVIFSKLEKRQWPKKVLLEDLLTTYLESIKFPLYDSQKEFTSSKNNINDKQLPQYCPVGIIPWEETTMGRQGSWGYTGDQREIEWIFDMRQTEISHKYYQRRKDVLELKVTDSLKGDKIKARSKVLSGAFDSEQFSLWCNPQWKFHVFVSSTFTDTHLERNIIMNDIAPLLRQLCLGAEIDVAFSDMRWGIPKDLSQYHATWTECEQEIRRCKEDSNYFFFLSLQSRKYGYIPLPRTIISSKYNSCFLEVTDHQRALLSKWYTLDTNAIPPVYTLRNLTTKPVEDDFKVDESLLLDTLAGLSWQKEDGEEDGGVSGFAVGKSVTEYEVRYAVRGAPGSSTAYTESRKNGRIMWMRRDFTGGTSDPAFDDCSGNSEKEQKLDRLLSWMETNIPPSYIFKQSIDFSQYLEMTKSDTNTNNNNKTYVRFVNQFKIDILSILTKALQLQVKRRRDWEADSFGLGLPGSLCAETMLHYQWAKSCCEDYVGYVDQLNLAMSAVLGSPRPVPMSFSSAHSHFEGLTLSIAGPVGCGKSSFMSVLANRIYRSSKRNERPVIVRFCGISSDSSKAPALVTNLCHHIHFVTGRPFGYKSVPSVYEDSVKYLHLLLNRNAVLLFLDGLDALSDERAGRSSLSFLRGVRPHPHTRIVVSVTSSYARGETRGSTPPTSSSSSPLYVCDELLCRHAVPRQWLPGDALSTKVEDVVGGKLLRLGRTLTAAQWSYVGGRAADEPTALYYSLSTMILKDWTSGSSTGSSSASGGLDDDSRPTLTLPTTIPLLVSDIVDRFKRRFGKALIEESFAFISYSVNGVTEEELLCLLFKIKGVKSEVTYFNVTEVLPKHVWLRVRDALGPLLVERDSRCLCWRYTQFKLNVIAQYTEAETSMYINALADYYANTSHSSGSDDIAASDAPLATPCQSVLLDTSSKKFFRATVNKRRCVEAVHQLIQAKRYAEAKKELCGIEKVLARIRTGTLYSMMEQMELLLRVGGAGVTDDGRLRQYCDWATSVGTTLGADCDLAALKLVMANASASGTSNTPMVDRDIYDFIHNQDDDGVLIHSNLHDPALRRTPSWRQQPLSPLASPLTLSPLTLSPSPLFSPVMSSKNLFGGDTLRSEESRLPGTVLEYLSSAQELDLLIHVEYCCRCERHNASLRHNSKKYFRVASDVLQDLAQLVLECRLSVRLGVVAAPIRSTDRIGAMEVNVGYRDYEGRLSTLSLHSKRASQLWPSFPGMSRQLNQFLSDCELSLHSAPESLIKWENTELSKSNWEAVPDKTVWVADFRDKTDSYVSFDMDWKKNKVVSLHLLPESGNTALLELYEAAVDPVNDVAFSFVNSRPRTFPLRDERVVSYCRKMASSFPYFEGTIKLVGFLTSERLAPHDFIIDLATVQRILLTFLSVDAIAIIDPNSDVVSVKYQLKIEKQASSQMSKYREVYLYVADAAIGVLIGSRKIALQCTEAFHSCPQKRLRFFDPNAKALIKADLTATFREFRTGRRVSVPSYYGIVVIPLDCYPGSWTVEVSCAEYEYCIPDVIDCVDYHESEYDYVGSLTAEGAAVADTVASISRPDFGRDHAKAVYHKLRIAFATILKLGAELAEKRSVIESTPVELQQIMVDSRVAIETTKHSTICSVCTSLCHKDCSLTRIDTPGSNQFKECLAFTGDNCVVCAGKCSYTTHYHDNKTFEIRRVPAVELLATTTASSSEAPCPPQRAVSTYAEAMKLHSEATDRGTLAATRTVKALVHLLSQQDMVTELKLFCDQSHDEHMQITNDYVRTLSEKYESNLSSMLAKISEGI